MRRIKQTLSALLACVLALALSAPAFAAGPTYSITIQNTDSTHTYTAYQIFKGDLSGSEEGDDKYVLSNIQWGRGVNTTGLIDALKAVEPFKTGLTGITDPTAADVARLLQDAADLEAFLGVVNGDPGYLSSTAAGTATPTEGAASCTIELSEAGYYLVLDSHTGEDTDYYISDYIVQVLGQETMAPKGDKPSIEKKVYEESLSGTATDWGNGYNDVADYDIGDAVPFKLVAKIPDMTGYNGYEFVITDSLSNGLTLNAGTIAVYVASGKDAATPGNGLLTADEDYTLNTTEAPATGGGSFAITLTDMEGNTKLTDETDNYLIVTYTATLNDNAVVGLDGNPNDVILEYSNDPNGEGKGKTPKDYAVVFTYELDGTKVDGEDGAIKLGGAQFVLLKKNAGNDYYAAQVGEDGKLDGWVKVEAGDTELPADTTTWTAANWAAFDASVVMTSTAEDGAFGVIGLDEGTYYLREIQAPTGYNLLDQDLTVTIAAATGNVDTYDGGNAEDILTTLTVTTQLPGAEHAQADGNVQNGTVAITVENNQGTTLPETGGMGTTIFYVIGGLLVVGVVVVLVARRKLDDER